MKMNKISVAVGVVLTSSLFASPAVFAHASFILPSTAGSASPGWLNGVPVLGVESQDPSTGANLPVTGFLGVHGATTSNARIIETGVYAPYTGTGSPSSSDLGGSFGNYTTNNTTSGMSSSGMIATSPKNTLLGQLYNYNNTAGNTSYGVSSSDAVMTTQGSWNTSTSAQNNIYDPSMAGTGNYNASGINTGLLYTNPYAGSGSSASTPNGEVNIMASTGAQYLNVAIAPDAHVGASNFLASGATAGSNSGLDLLTYAIYQGDATGPGLQGMVLLGSGTASMIGGEVDFSVALTGNYLNNNPYAGGEFTLVIGDASQSTDPSNAATYIAAGNYDPYVKIGIWESGNSSTLSTTGSGSYATVYSEAGTAPVPVPGAVWLFGSVMAGWLGLGRRKSA